MKSLSVVLAFFLMSFISPNLSFAQVSVDPFGFTVSLEQDAETDIELTLTNNNEEDVAFNINYQAISDEEERLIGPRRDEPGEILAEFRVGFFNTVGLAWDPENQLMWALAWSDGFLCAIDIENGEEVVRINARSMLGLFYFDGVLYAGGYNNAVNTIYRFDTEGNAIGNWRIQQNLTWTTIGGDGNYIYTVTYPNGGGRGDVHVFEFQDNPEEVAVIDCNEWIGEEAWGIEIIPAHRRGYLWLADRENLYQFSVDEEWNADLVQQFETVNSSHTGLAHDGENLWRGIYDGETRIWYMIDDGELESLGFIMNTMSGVIQANNNEVIEIHISSVNCEVGVYHVLINIGLTEPEQERDDFEQSLIEISAVLSIGEPTYTLSGVVTSAENHSPIEGVSVKPDCYSIIRQTDAEGVYLFENIPPETYDFTFSAVDFLPTVETVEIGEEDVELNVALLHSDCTPSQNQFFMQLEPDFSREFEFRVDNGGNGPLTYSVDRRLLGEANTEPFELRRTDEIEGLLEDNMLAGAVFAEGNFFISGGNNGDNPNKIYVLNTEREVVREFEQFVEDRYGMRDLAYDGELIWGAVLGTFYGFTTEGELVTSFEIDSNIEGRALAWDPVNQVLLASDISSDILAINREGEIVETYRRPAELRIYGLGVWPDDPDGYYLYVFCRGPGDVGINAFKLNPATGEYMLAAYFDVEGRPSGIQITNQLDVYSWVIVALVQNPDRLNVWQLAARKEWFHVDINEGVIEPNEYEEFVLTLDATGLPPDNDFRGEVVFMHDGVGSETVLDVTLSVVEGRVPTTRNVDLHIGWNAISTNLQPNDYENVEGLVSSIVENGSMIMMKNGNGDFYRPEYEFNNIRAWNSWEGFQMLMASAATLTLAGESMLRQDPIDLTQGWQLVSYYPRYEIEAIEALATISDNLIIAKDGYGNFYLPAWDDFSNMGNMREGQGYYINVNADCRLIYVPEEEEDERSASISQTKSVYDKSGQLPVHAITGENMSLLVTSDVSLKGEVGVYASGELVGSGIIQDGTCGIAVWGDDLSTDLIDGAVSGSALEIRMLTDNGLQDASYTILSGKLTYETDGLAVIRLTGASELPLEFGIVSAYPNPFNSQMRVSYSLLETGIVDLAAYDVSGRRIAELTSGRQPAGVHTIMFDGNGIPSGVYMLRLLSSGQSSMIKVMLVK